MKFKVAVSILVLLGANCFGQEVEKDSKKQVVEQGFLAQCREEVEKFCSDQKIAKDIIKCLASHSSDLSLDCRQAMERTVQMLSEAENRGGGTMAGFGGPNAMGPPIPYVSYEGRKTRGDADPTMTENKFNFSVPFYRQEAVVLSSSLSLGQLKLSDQVILNNGKTISENFYRYELGMQYFKRLPEKRMFTVRVSAGYVGDDPSQYSRDASYSLNLTYGEPSHGENSNGYWMYMVYMTNNSSFINYFPIPGVVYLYKTAEFTGLFGFPILSLQWTPSELWSYSFSLFGPNLQTETSFGDRRKVQMFMNYSFNQQSYIPHERAEDRDRLTLQDQKLSMGFRMSVLKMAQLELQIGRTYDRSIYIGRGFMNKDGGVAGLDPDWFSQLSFKAGF